MAAPASASASSVAATGGTAAERAARREAKKRVLLSGLITAIGIALHNFPEVCVALLRVNSSVPSLYPCCAVYRP